MYLFNPLQPGSVYTDILADGAVTLVKTDFATNPLPVTAGGTGSSNPSPAATAPLTLSGTWPNQTIALTTPLSVADGGTGTATPAVTAGANITVTGTWPDVTVGVSDPPTFGDIDCSGNDSITSAPPASSSNLGWKLRLYSLNYAIGVCNFTICLLTNPWFSVFGDGSLPANDGTASTPDSHAGVSLGADGSIHAATLQLSGAVQTLDGESLTGPGVPGIVASFQGTAQATVDVITFTPSADGYYRITAWVHRAPGGTTDNADVEVFYYPPDDSTEQISFDPIPTTSIAAGSALDGQGSFYAASGTEIDVRVGDADTTNYSAHFRIVVEYLGS